MKPPKPILLASRNLDDLRYAIITLQSNRLVNPLKAVSDAAAAREYLLENEPPALVLLPFEQMENEERIRHFAPVMEFTNLETLSQANDFCGFVYKRGIGGFYLDSTA